MACARKSEKSSLPQSQQILTTLKSRNTRSYSRRRDEHLIEKFEISWQIFSAANLCINLGNF